MAPHFSVTDDGTEYSDEDFEQASPADASSTPPGGHAGSTAAASHDGSAGGSPAPSGSSLAPAGAVHGGQGFTVPPANTARPPRRPPQSPLVSSPLGPRRSPAQQASPLQPQRSPPGPRRSTATTRKRRTGSRRGRRRSKRTSRGSRSRSRRSAGLASPASPSLAAGSELGSAASGFDGASVDSRGSPGTPMYGFGTASPGGAAGNTLSSVFLPQDSHGGDEAGSAADGERGEGGGRPKFGEAKHGEREWENEVARNILQLYRADVHTQAQQLAQEEAERAEAAAQAALDAASPGARRSNLVAVSAPKYEPRRRRSSLPKITATSLDKPSTAQDVLPRPGKPVDPTMTGTSRPLKRVLRLVPKPKRDSDSGTFV